MSKINKNIVIMVMFLVIVGLVVYVLLSSTSSKNSVLNDVLSLQSEISYHLGKTRVETFNAYDNIQILTGYADEKEIKNNDNKALVPFADKSSKFEKNGKVYYKLNIENIQNELKIKLNNSSGIEYYIEDGKYVRLKVDVKPGGWNKNFNEITI